MTKTSPMIQLSALVPLEVAAAVDRLSDESREPVDAVVETLLRAALIAHERLALNQAELAAAA